MRFYKMNNRKREDRQAPYFLKCSTSAGPNSNNPNISSSKPSTSAMEVENDFLKLDILEYPDGNQDGDCDWVNLSNNRMNLKIRYSLPPPPPHDIFGLFAKAIRMNNLSKVIQMVEIRGHSVNVYDANSRTPLHMAASSGHFSICKFSKYIVELYSSISSNFFFYFFLGEYLLKKSASPNRKDSIGNTPLHLAACSSRVDIVNLLITYGAVCDIKDSTGFSPLTLATSKLRMMLSSIRKYRDVQKFEELKQRCEEIVKMLEICSTANQLSSLDLQTVRNVYDDKFCRPKESSDIENDVNELLNSITALKIDQK